MGGEGWEGKHARSKHAGEVASPHVAKARNRVDPAHGKMLIAT